MFVRPRTRALASSTLAAFTIGSLFFGSPFAPSASAVELSVRLPNVESSSTPEKSGVPLPRGALRLSPATLSPAAPATASSLGPNLIPNPSLETAGSGGAPAHWHSGGYGSNTRSFTYPATPAENGSAAASLTVSSRASGDAKWYFDDVAITGGATYQFSDYYRASAPSVIDVRYKFSDGSYGYYDVAAPPASASYRQAVARFQAPAGAVSLTVFHLVNRNGSLTTDDYALAQVTLPASDSSNLIENPGFEAADVHGAPLSWQQGGYGTNARTFAYPAGGVSGGAAGTVSITAAGSGDAKWYFAPVPVTAGSYTYADQYLATEPSIVTAAFKHSDGTYTYADLATLPAASSFTRYSGSFTVPSGVSAVSVFHLIKGAGSLTLDDASLRRGSGAGSIFSTGAVTLRFDDAWLSQYQNARPKLLSAGIPATFYIVTHQLSDDGYPGFMSQAQVKQLYSDGEDVAAHTRTHPDLVTLSSSQQQQEIQGSRQDLLSWGISPVDSFSYPYGSYNQTSIQLVKDAGFSGAAATIDGEATPSSDPYQLEREVVLSNTSLSQMESWIDTAIADHAWLILELHEVNTSGDTYSITPSNFNALVDYLVAHRVPVVTVSQGLKSL